jgi:hypothetical protein
MYPKRLLNQFLAAAAVYPVSWRTHSRSRPSGAHVAQCTGRAGEGGSSSACRKQRVIEIDNGCGHGPGICGIFAAARPILSSMATPKAACSHSPLG